MSSASAGRFQDHYEVLGIEHKATSDAVQSAYVKLVQQFHPRTGSVPDQEKFDAVTLAYEVLSDPELRGDFDKLKGLNVEGPPLFSGRPFFKALGRDAHLRSAILCVLYDRRRTKPFTPAISMRHMDGMLAATQEEINMALWYLKKRSLVGADDKSSMAITVEGIDYLEAEMPKPENVLPMLKPTSVVAVESDAPAPVDAAAAVTAELPQLAAAVEAEHVKAPSQSSAGSAMRIGNALAKRG